MAGMRDVAKLAGVSLSTVSVVLSEGTKYVSEGNRIKVWDAVKELDYKMPPKKIFSQKTVAMVLPNVTSSFFSNLLSGVERTIAKEKSLLLYHNSNYDFEKEKTCIKTLEKQSLRGIILDSVCPLEQEGAYLKWLKSEFIEKGIPVVLLERDTQIKGFCCIYVDNFSCAYMATRHLIDKNHKIIAHISGNDKMLHTKERYEGYCKALKEMGLELDQELIVKGDFTPVSGYVAMKRLLEIRNDFTALFSANDQMAIGAIKAIKAMGKRVPQDIAVIGFDNLSVSSLIEPGLSTVNVPTYQMGKIAVELIMDAQGGAGYEKRVGLDTNLIIRRSSDENATNEWELTGW